jgi:GTP-binding protein
MSFLRTATFELSAAKTGDLPPSSLPEVAFAGRSNAGKSSAINTLVGHKRLAFVSRTPGRTQLVNFFRCGAHGFLVDLPGYGYAQVPEDVRRTWQELLEHYLTRRAALRGLVMVMDARRPLTGLDVQMLDWFATTHRPVHVLLTKADKLTRGEAAATLRETEHTLAGPYAQATVQLFSSLKRTGTEEATAVIGRWLGVEERTPG